MLEFVMGKKKKLPYKAPDAKRDWDQLVKISRQNLQDFLDDDPAPDALVDLARALKKIKKKAK
jgi:hypothetical protein